MQVIMQVQSGTLIATQAAAVLGISRKTYYEWEKKFLSCAVEALTVRKPGRPKKDAHLDQTMDRIASRNRSLTPISADPNFRSRFP